MCNLKGGRTVNQAMVKPTKQGKLEKTLTLIHKHQPTRSLYCSCYVPSREEFYLGYSSRSDCLSVVEMKTLKMINFPIILGGLTDIYLTKDQTLLGICGTNACFYLFDIISRKVQKSFTLGSTIQRTFQFSEGDQGAYLAGTKQTLTWINFETDQITDLKTETLSIVWRGCLTISSTKRVLYGSGKNSKLGCVSLKRGLKFSPLKTPNLTPNFRCSVLSQDDGCLFSGNMQGNVCVNSTRSWKLQLEKSFEGAGNITRLRVIPNLVIGAGFNFVFFVFRDRFPFEVLLYTEVKVNIFDVNISDKYILVGGFGTRTINIYENSLIGDKQSQDIKHSD